MTAPTLRKRERMVSQKLIETLFGGGSSLSMAAYPLRVVYMKTNRQYGDVPVQLLISVPKKRFKHAVDRNLVKRQVREAFRQHKQVVYDALPEEEMVLMAFVWLSQEHYSSQEVEKRVVSLLKRMAEKL
ncbi:MAG: ribonuclease P protein component [Prevotella sp.]|nr:ribonuclease P protein component [Prevotella sp.]MBR3078659.1 ribonuclease P protein component [Prevotella sp.]